MTAVRKTEKHLLVTVSLPSNLKMLMPLPTFQIKTVVAVRGAVKKRMGRMRRLRVDLWSRGRVATETRGDSDVGTGAVMRVVRKTVMRTPQKLLLEEHQNNRGEEVHVGIGEDVVMDRTAVRREVRKTVMWTPQKLPLEENQNNIGEEVHVGIGEDVVMDRTAVRGEVRKTVMWTPQKLPLEENQ